MRYSSTKHLSHFVVKCTLYNEEWLAPTLLDLLPKHFGAAQTHQIRNAPPAWLYYHPHVRAKHGGFFDFWECTKCCQEKEFIRDRYLRKPSPEWSSALTIFLVSIGSPLLVSEHEQSFSVCESVCCSRAFDCSTARHFAYIQPTGCHRQTLRGNRILDIISLQRVCAVRQTSRSCWCLICLQSPGCRFTPLWSRLSDSANLGA